MADIEITREVLDSLAAKLDAFGEGLTTEEQALLGTVLSAGVRSTANEVEPYHKETIDIPSWSLGASIGAVLQTSAIVGAWPKSLEIGQLKAGDTS